MKIAWYTVSLCTGALTFTNSRDRDLLEATRLVLATVAFHTISALLVASRLHNFSRSVREVAKVVKLSEGTIRKRLGDFRDTPSSRLTIDEFLKVDLEQEHDPPSYIEAKRKAKVRSGGVP